MNPVIEVKSISRRFGAVEAVSNLSFTINEGTVTGFIGANGAGKTTTMRMLVTLDSPDRGNIIVSGFDTLAQPREVRNLIGWMPDTFSVYDGINVSDYLDFFARAFGLHGRNLKQRLDEVIAFVEIGDLLERPAARMSKGQLQRLCLARALLGDPQVIIMDEPAAGLDPKARVEFKQLVRLLSKQGKTLFISSHILSELGEMCDELLFIDNGQLVHQGTSESLTMRVSGGLQLVRVRLVGDPAALVDWSALQPGTKVRETFKDGVLLELEGGEAVLVDTLRRLVQGGFAVSDFHREDQRLEQAFINLLREKAGA